MNYVFNQVAKLVTYSADPPAPFAPELKARVLRITSAWPSPAVAHDSNAPELADGALGCETVWYFAFGSNLNPAVFTTRRRMDHLQGLFFLNKKNWRTR